MVLKVFVRDIAVTIYIKPTEGLEHLGLTLKGLVFNLTEQFTQTTCLLVISTLEQPGFSCAKLFVGENGRRVGTLGSDKLLSQLREVLLKDNRGN